MLVLIKKRNTTNIMLKKEFDARIGRVSDANEFDKANLAYTEFRDIDKDEFCRLYRATFRRADSEKFAVGLMDIIVRQDKALREQSAVIAEISRREDGLKVELDSQISTAELQKEHVKFEIACRLMDLCYDEFGQYSKERIESYIIDDLICVKAYLHYKIKKGYELSDRDKEMLSNLLDSIA